MNSKNQRAYGELYVTNYLLEQGIEVFRNVPLLVLLI